MSVRLRLPRVPLVASMMATWLCASLGAAGCGYLLRSPDRPTPAIRYAWSEERASCLLVLLPGILDDADAFEREGLVGAMHERAPSCDIVAVDTHLYDYQDESIVARVYEDIVLEARGRGYSRIWMVGVSMGAVGAILTARAHPRDVDGLVLVSPFLGTQRFSTRFEREVEHHGGLARWAATYRDRRPRMARVLHDPRPLWSWLAGYETSPSAMPPLYVAFGRDDRFAGAQRLLATLVPAECAFEVDGSHDWSTWRRIVDEVLDAIPLDEPPEMRTTVAGAPSAEVL